MIHLSRLCSQQRAWLTIIALLWWQPGHSAQPGALTIEADKAKIDEKAGISIYSGNVHLTRDTITVQADKITVHTHLGKFSKVTAIGTPVSFTRESKESGNPLQGQALQLEYLAENDVIVLIEQAQLVQGKNSFSGNRIEYNAKTDVVTAGDPTQTDQRVKVTIQPDNPSTPDEPK